MKGEISLKQAIDEYREIYLAYRNFSKRTRVEYVNDLEDLAAFLQRIGIEKVGEITLPHLVHYLAELEKRGFAGSTRKRRVIAIRSFFSFLRMEGYILSDIGKKIIPPYVKAQEPRYLTTEEQNRLLECAKPNIRDYAIIQLLLQTGIKLSELTGLRLADLRTLDSSGDKKSAYIWISPRTKGKGRAIPLNSDAGSTVSKYFSVRETSSSDYLFLNKSGEQLGKRGVEKAIDKYFGMADIKNASVNSLRHTFGNHLVENGVDKKNLQKVLGLTGRESGKYYSSF